MVVFSIFLNIQFHTMKDIFALTFTIESIQEEAI